MSELVKGAEIEINGVKYPLKFNFKAMLHFEKTTGKKFFAFINELAKIEDENKQIDPAKLDLEGLAVLFQSFVISGGQKITLDEVADILDFGIILDFLKLIPTMIKNGNPPKQVSAEATDDKKEDKGVAEDKNPLA